VSDTLLLNEGGGGRSGERVRGRNRRRSFTCLDDALSGGGDAGTVSPMPPVTNMAAYMSNLGADT